MGFSAGASNAANAVAPLVGNGTIEANPAILLAVGAISVGGFTIARRTLETVGDDITELPILAALIVSTVGATIISILSWLGIPASLAVSTTSCIIGLGWGRASRVKSLTEMAVPPASEKPPTEMTTGALASSPTVEDDDTPASPTVGELADDETRDPDEQVADGGVAPIGEEEPKELTAESLFDPTATARIVSLWVITPTVSLIGAYLVFLLVT